MSAMDIDQEAPYNSELEKQLFESLTNGTVQKATRVKPSVRFQENQTVRERDSQKRREFKGRPGSRRHVRHMNKIELIDKALSDSESELEIEVEFTVSFKSPFTILFENEEVKEDWEPFVEVTEEDQSSMLSMYYPDPTERQISKKPNGFSTDPQECFKLLSRDEKKFLVRKAGNSLISQMETVIIDFILSRRKTLSLSLPEYDRMIFNCCCVYYSLLVSAETLPTGEINETIHKPKGIQLPSTKLSDYLKTLPRDD